MPIIFSIQEIADQCKRSYETVRGWITDGQLEAVRVNKQYFITATAFENFLKSHSTFSAEDNS